MSASLTPPYAPSSQAEQARGRNKTDILTLHRVRSQFVSRAPIPRHRLWTSCGLVVPVAFPVLSSPSSDPKPQCH